MLLVVQVRSDRLKTSNFGKEEAAAAAKKNQTNKKTIQHTYSSDRICK